MFAFLVRILGAVGGFLGVALIGIFVMVAVIVFSGSTFGLHNIRSVVLAFAVIGTALGFLFPKEGILGFVYSPLSLLRF